MDIDSDSCEQTEGDDGSWQLLFFESMRHFLSNLQMQSPMRIDTNFGSTVNWNVWIIFME